MVDAQEDMLKEGSESRRMAVSLKGIEYGDQLVSELFEHSGALEKLYGLGQAELAKGKSSDFSKFRKIIGVYEERTQWYQKAKAYTAVSFSKILLQASYIILTYNVSQI